MEDYLKACQTIFWQKVFEEELAYLIEALKSYKSILSIGCGPAIIERGLQAAGFQVTGLDVSEEALNGAPDNVRTIVGNAQAMPLEDSSYDAAIYVASLQFIEDYKSAIRETSRILKPQGGLVVMLLNPESEHFKKGVADSGNYMSRIKHRGLAEIEQAIQEHFEAKAEYFLGISKEEVFKSEDPKKAALYVIKGVRKQTL